MCRFQEKGGMSFYTAPPTSRLGRRATLVSHSASPA
jgi:hypothetical protein